MNYDSLESPGKTIPGAEGVRVWPHTEEVRDGVISQAKGQSR